MNLSYHSSAVSEVSLPKFSNTLERTSCAQGNCLEKHKKESILLRQGNTELPLIPAVLGSVHSDMQSPISFRTKQPGLYLGTVRTHACAVLFNKDVHVSVSACFCVYRYI